MIKGFEEDKGEIHRSWKDKVGSMGNTGDPREIQRDPGRPLGDTRNLRKKQEEIFEGILL
jgi:hypothetical protein